VSEITPFEQLASLDRLVHDPARLAILTALSACERADFLFLLRITGLTKGNLSSHLSRLEQAGLVEIEKRFVDKKTQTLARLSREGRDAVEEYWKEMDALRRRAARWRPPKLHLAPAGG
jgi:DNA-binding transcriptional ArsR family regulator